MILITKDPIYKQEKYMITSYSNQVYIRAVQKIIRLST